MKKKLFDQETVLPDVVENRIDETLALIRMQNKEHVKSGNIRKMHYRRKMAAMIAVAMLGIGGTAVAAGVYFHWGRSIEQGMQATDEQKQKLEDEQMVETYEEDVDYSSLAVTQNGVTVTPTMAIADENYARVIFTVSGYQAPNHMQPGFVVQNAYFVDQEEKQPNQYAMFYDGTIMDDEGRSLYDDGSPMELDENGQVISRWVDDQGNMEYFIVLSRNDLSGTMIGQTLHVELQNLGYYEDKLGTVTTEVEGNWNFDLNLPQKSASTALTVGQTVHCGKYSFVLDEIVVSPISTKLNYTVEKGTEPIDRERLYEEHPRFWGYVLQDGSRIICYGGGGSIGVSDERSTDFTEKAGHRRIVDADQIAKVLLHTTDGDVLELDVKRS
ncbi:MAG: DUF4179 domain-containing protein [Eubacteriales bacterium]|nr:DUF4179 domain-containing protein [Eubacteriales bacterium]